MDIPQIKTKLQDLFSQHRIIFWNDAEVEFEDSLPDLNLPDVEIIRLDQEGQFKTKMILEGDKPQQKFLIYSTDPIPDCEEDWLLDIRLYSYQFTADRASVLIDELGLKNHHLREHLNQRKKFFANKDRISGLKKRIAPEDTASEIDRKMLAVVVKSEHDDFLDVVRTLYHAMAGAGSLDELPAVWEQIEKLKLEEVFWGFVRSTLGYADDQPSLRNLLTSLLITDLAYALGDDLPDSLKHFVLPYSNQSNVVVCLAQWRDSSSKGRSYDSLSRMTAKAVGLSASLAQIKLDTLLQAETFLDIEKVIARKLRDRVIGTAATINADDIIQMAQARQDKHWANIRLEDRAEVPRKALNAAYEAIIKAAEFFALKNAYAGEFDYDTAKALYDAYCKELYKFDQFYRLFCEYADLAEAQGWGLLKDLQETVEDAYCNWYLEPLASKWGQLATTDQWAIEDVLNQYDFYRHRVRWVAGKKKSRGKVTAYVIISDAFRYEAAEELTGLLNGKYRFTAELQSILGVLPSYTALGMAVLLPHDKCTVNDKGDILVDGKPCASAQQRNAILAKHHGLAVKAPDLLKMKKEEGRDFVRDKDIVYIYHNTIDAMGDSAPTEAQTIRAVRNAIDELADVVRFVINNLNGSQIFITADHGFLYTTRKPGETEKNKLTDKPKSAVKRNKRYLIGRKLPEVKHSHTGKLSNTAGIDPETDMAFALPKGLSLFYFTGGSRFIHGGMSLQEVVVPVVIAKQVHGKGKQDTKERKVSVQVLGANFRITTNRHRFQLLQTEAVSERVKAVTIKAAVYDGDKPVTNIESITFDSSSDNMTDRTKWVTLSLQNIPFDRDKAYRLVLQDTETKIEAQSAEVRIDRAFAEDF